MGTYFRSWFGRFEAVATAGPTRGCGLPAAVLVVLGLLMVLNTTYFLGQEKTGDAFHFFKLHLAHIVAGLVHADAAVAVLAGRAAAPRDAADGRRAS